MTLPWEQAWAERERLLRIAIPRAVDASEAEDVVQEAMVRCVTFANLDVERLPAMLTTVTLRLCVDRLRDRLAAERAAHRLAFADSGEALDQVLDRAEAAWLAAETARLAGREHAALVARFLGLSVAETAEALSVTYKAAESALDRARRKLRAAWAATLGVVGWLRVKLRAATPATTAAALLTTVSVLTTVPGTKSSASAGEVLRTVGYERPEPRAARAVRATSARTVAAALMPRGRLADAPSARAVTAPTLTTPPVSVGRVRKDPARVWTDTEDPVGRVVRCVTGKPEITVSVEYVAVTCREEP